MPIDREFPITMFDYLSVSPEKKNSSHKDIVCSW
jgi:hypothetical protein